MPDKPDGWTGEVVAGLLGNITHRHLDMSDEDLLQTIELVPVPILLATDPACSAMHANRAGQALFMVPASQNVSQSAPADERPPFAVYAEGQILPAHDLPMQRAAAAGTAVSGSECEIRFGDGTVKYIAGHCEPLFDRTGGVRGSIGAFVDVTNRKLLEQRNKFLLAELAHRNTNNLALVLAIASQTVKPHLSASAYSEFEQRLTSLGRANGALGKMEGGSSLVPDVVRAFLMPLVADFPSKVVLCGDQLPLSSTGMFSLALALHELATNAIKYGALSVPDGQVVIRWAQSTENADKLDLHWSERGGPTVSPPTRSGFGSKLLQTVLKVRSGDRIELLFSPEGFEFRAASSLLAPPSGAPLAPS